MWCRSNFLDFGLNVLLCAMSASAKRESLRDQCSALDRSKMSMCVTLTVGAASGDTQQY